MPHKQKNSRFYRVSRTLPGFGSTGRLSTQTTSKKVAEEYEQLLEWMADQEMYDLLEALRPTGPGKSGRVHLADIRRARKEDRLEQLRRTLRDPLIEEVVREFAPLVTYKNHRTGLQHLLRLTVDPDGPRLAPPKARLSWLTEAKHINTVMSTMIAEGYKPRTVNNSAWGALSKLLQHEFGKARAESIMAEAARPYADDRRDLWLSAEECYRVISACEWEVRMFLLLSAALGIDVTPTLRIRSRDFDAERWTLFVRDTKERKRKRTVDLSPVAVYVLTLLSSGKDPNDLLFSLSKGQVAYRWRLAREAALLTREKGFHDTARQKDFRHTFAVHYLKSGGNLASLAGRMGHAREAQSLAYARHEARGTSDMEAAAEAMGLKLPARLLDSLTRPQTAAAPDLEMPLWWFDRSAPPETGRTVGGYAQRGTAGYAEDPKAYWRERHARKKAS